MPAYEAGAPVSVTEVLTLTKRCAAKTGGSGRSNGEAMGEAGRSVTAEGRDGVADCEMEYALLE